MVTTIETIHQDIIGLRKDIEYVKNILSEEFELSEHVKKALKEARETPENEYVNL